VEGVCLVTVIHDSPFDFNEQNNYVLHPTLAVHAGDSIRTDCTDANNDATTLSLFDCTEGHP
jgi:hypothetical protein